MSDWEEDDWEGGDLKMPDDDAADAKKEKGVLWSGHDLSKEGGRLKHSGAKTRSLQSKLPTTVRIARARSQPAAWSPVRRTATRAPGRARALNRSIEVRGIEFEERSTPGQRARRAGCC